MRTQGVRANYTKCLVLLRAAENRPQQGKNKLGGMAEPPRRGSRPNKTSQFCSTAAMGAPDADEPLIGRAALCPRAPRISRSCGVTVAFFCC